MDVEVILRRVKPETVQKLQVDGVALEKDVLAKQKAIEKLQSDLVIQQQMVAGLAIRVGTIENLNP